MVNYKCIIQLMLTTIISACTANTRMQEDIHFTGRLSVLPVDRATVRTISGWGNVTAVLIDKTLSISGTFEGLSSQATVAHLHLAARGQRGPVAFPLNVTTETNGKLYQALKLKPEHIELLNNGFYYVQIHTETNPDGEIRGWLLPREPES